MDLRAVAVAGLLMGLFVGGCGGGSSSGGDTPPPATPQSPDDDAPPPDDPPDEPPPPDDTVTATIAVDDVTVEEGAEAVAFIVRVDGAADDEVRVDYATTDGTALAGADFVETAGTLVFAAGETEQTVEVQVLDDAEPEGEKTFNLEISNPLNAQIADDTGVATLIDDEEIDACGEPTIFDAEPAAFLWKDCSNGTWRLRVFATDAAVAYAGAVTSSAGFTNAVPVGTEADDVVGDGSGTTLEFSLATAVADGDGLNFVPAEGADACFELTSPEGSSVLIGPDRVPLSGAFDLDTFGSCGDDGGGGSASNLNVVVVFTDDQRFDTLEHMPNVTTRLMPIGVNFENAYVPTPLCCPARASTYSGGFLAQNTNVLDNNPPNGGMGAFDDHVNIGTRLQEAGYRTLFIGKWLNDYVNFTPYVPPGWDTFLGRASWVTAQWTNFHYISGSSGQSSTVGEEIQADDQYNVYFERDRIIDFLEAAPEDEPYFVFWSTTPPHPPATPDQADADSLADFTYRGRGVGETDLSDKPSWVQDSASDPNRPTGDDEEIRDQLRTLLAVDRALGSLIDVVESRGELEETVFIVMSDNGFMWGEHGLWAKNKPYEESIRVPLLVAIPGIEPRTDDHLVYAVLDVPATLFEIAGVTAESDGTSLLPLLRDPATDWRNELFFEKFTIPRSKDSIWAGVRRDNWKYIEYVNGEAELYDLAADPFELENLAGDPAFDDTEASLEARMDEQLGLAIRPVFQQSDGRVGEPYSLQLELWGGKPPVTFSMESGELPPGLSLDPATGEISGTPTTAGSWTFSVRVTGSVLATQRGEPRTFIRPDVTIVIR